MCLKMICNDQHSRIRSVAIKVKHVCNVTYVICSFVVNVVKFLRMYIA